MGKRSFSHALGFQTLPDVRWLIRGEFAEPLELNHFPFDTQECLGAGCFVCWRS